MEGIRRLKAVKILYSIGYIYDLVTYLAMNHYMMELCDTLAQYLIFYAVYRV
jgi:hypothetical protein